MKHYNTDLEGLIVLNDSAQELAELLIPNGGEFFANLSVFDDVLAMTGKTSAGRTVGYIAPFLRAYGATDQQVWDHYSNPDNILLLDGIQKTLQYIMSIMPVFIVSTAHRHFAHSVCELIGFPKEQVSCTDLELDAVNLSPKQMRDLREIVVEIACIPMIKLPGNAKSINDLSVKSQTAVKRLNAIFQEKIPKISAAAAHMYTTAQIVDGDEKAKIVMQNAKSVKGRLSDIMYVGDGSTDEVAMLMVKQGSGMPVAFNASPGAIKNSNIAVVSAHTVPCALLASIFKQKGTQGLLEAINDPDKLTHSLKQNNLFEVLLKLENALAPEIQEQDGDIGIVVPQTKELLIKKSADMRESLRGKAGKLS